MALGKTVFFKKLIKGSVSLHLQDVDGILPSRWFAMDHKVPRIGVPMSYALSIFIDATIEKMMKQNYFEIENINELLAAAKEKGYVSLSEEEVQVITAPKRTNETLVAILKGGNKSKIKELFESNDKQRAIHLATENVKLFSLEAIAVIEDVLGMAITEE